jgi:hypothetical protein
MRRSGCPIGESQKLLCWQGDRSQQAVHNHVYNLWRIAGVRSKPAMTFASGC